MKIKTIIIGDVTSDLGVWATSEFPGSQLLGDHNFDHLPKTDVLYTSLHDISANNLFNLCSQAERIILHEPDEWSNEDLKERTTAFLVGCGFIVENFHGDSCGVLKLSGRRISDKPQLWIVGCSYAAGWIELTRDQVYGTLLAKMLNLDVTFLTRNGGSIDWAADQILRSSLIPGDIIVWGITGIARYLHLVPVHGTIPISPAVFDPNNPYYPLIDGDYEYLQKGLLSPDRFMWAVKHPYQIQNVCDLVGCHLVVMPHYSLSLEEVRPMFKQYLSKLPGYLELSPSVDFQSDNRHPGPKTQHVWAEEIANFIKQKGWV